MLYDGKRVVIVGPSACVLENTAENIESYDVVVRVNTGWPVSEAQQPFIGKRIDALYHNCTIRMKNPEGKYSIKNHLLKFSDELKEQLKLACFPFYSQSNWSHLMEFCEKHGIETYNIALDCRKLREMTTVRTGYSPNYGYAAIHHILSHQVKELYITGFTFYRQRYHGEHNPTPIGKPDRIVYNSKYLYSELRPKPHDPELELRHFLTKLWPENRDKIRLDDALGKIVAMEKMI